MIRKTEAEKPSSSLSITGHAYLTYTSISPLFLYWISRYESGTGDTGYMVYSDEDGDSMN